MGKIRRVRQKYHQSISKKNKAEELKDASKEEESVQKEFVGKSPLLKTAEEFAAIPDNLFEGIDINFDDLKKKLAEDDRVSVRSIAKSCKYDSKGKLLTKKEKQKLKHDLFMRKINTAQQLKKEALQKRKKRKGLMKKDSEIDTHIEFTPVGMEIGSHHALPDNTHGSDVNKEKKVKIKGIKKAKIRQKEMLQDISAFRKILANPKFVKDPCGTVTKHVQQRIIKEIQTQQ